MKKFCLALFLVLLISCQIYTGKDKDSEQKTESTKTEEISLSYKEPKSIADFLKKAPLDEFNAPKGNSKPKEGGQVIIRIPSDPRILNPMTAGEATANQIMTYIYDTLIIRDPESFEWLPWLASAWESKDRAVVNGKRLEGYYDDKKKLFYPGQGLVSALTRDIIPAGRGIFTVKGRRYSGKLSNLVYTTQIIPSLSGGIQVQEKNVEKQMIHVFYLRPGVFWHDGEPFTAKDILFSFQMIQNPATDAAHIRNYYQDIQEVKKINDYQIQFTYKKPYFQSLSFCGGIPILSAKRFQPEKFRGDEKALAEYFNSHPDNWKPIGTGPYIFQEWKKGQLITLEKNKNYWARKENFPYFKPQQPYLDKIQFLIINNVNAALKELMSGNIDMISDVTQSLWFDSRTLSEDFKGRFARARFVTPLYTYIGWNNDREYFKDARVRLAMSYLIPKEKILKEIHRDLGKVVTGPFFTEGPVYDRAIPQIPYEPAKARALLKEAGWIDRDGDGVRDKNGIKFEFEYLIHNALDYHQKIADIIKESLQEAGIVMNIRMIDWTIFGQTVMERNFDSVRFAWGTGIDGDEYQIWHSSQIGAGGSNFIGFRNKEIDQILEKARTVFDPLERWALYRKMHHTLHNLQPYTFLFSFDSLIFYNKKFRGVKFYSSGYNLMEWYQD